MTRLSVKTNHIIEKATKHWKYVAPLLSYPKNDYEYNLLVERLDYLLDIIGEDEDHPLIGLVDAISSVISAYDEQHFKILGSGIDALKFLMQQNNMTQSDLHEVGSQGVVSEILSGKRKLNLRQIKRLANIFNVSPNTFIDES